MRRPTVVDQAVAFAQSFNFTNSCLDEVGELLHVLVGHVRGGKIAEIGTGCGVSTAWIAGATTLDVYTVDNDHAKAAGIRGLFEGCSNVHPIFGEWEQILHEGPFQFIFVDAKPAKLYGIDKIVGALEIGGFILLDDFTPMECWTEEWKGKPDLIRDLWLGHRQLASIEIRTSQKASAILARRVI